MVRDLVLILMCVPISVVASGQAGAAARGTPAYYCREASYEKKYRTHLQELNRTIRRRSAGSYERGVASRAIRKAMKPFFATFDQGSRNIDAAIRSCRRATYAVEKAAIMAATRKADRAVKKEVSIGKTAIRAEAASFVSKYVALGKKWMDFTARCIGEKARSFGTGSMADWDNYRARMRNRVKRLNRKALHAKGTGTHAEGLLDRRYQREVRLMSRYARTLPLYPRPCTISVRPPTVGGWAGKWKTNRGALCIKARGGALKITPIGGGLLKRRRGRVEVNAASPIHVRGRWSIPVPKFDGRFEWRLIPGGGRFRGTFSEKPGGKMDRRWTGQRVGEC